MIAGLEMPTEGCITIDGVPVFDSDQGINIPPNAGWASCFRTTPCGPT